MRPHEGTIKPNFTNVRNTEKSFSAPQERSQYHGDPEELPVMAEDAKVHRLETIPDSAILEPERSEDDVLQSRNTKTEMRSIKNI